MQISTPCSLTRLIFSCTAASFLRVLWFVGPTLILSRLWGSTCIVADFPEKPRHAQKRTHLCYLPISI